MRNLIVKGDVYSIYTEDGKYILLNNVTDVVEHEDTLLPRVLSLHENSEQIIREVGIFESSGVQH